MRISSRSKYHTAPPSERRWQGRTYGSKAEMEYAKRLFWAREGGAIQDYVEQPRLWLGVPENKYVPDFLVVASDRSYYIDVKGIETAKFKRDKKLWASYGRLDLLIMKRVGVGQFVTTETILGGKAQ